MNCYPRKKRQTNANLMYNRKTGINTENTTIGPRLTRILREEIGDGETKKKGRLIAKSQKM